MEQNQNEGTSGMLCELGEVPSAIVACLEDALGQSVSLSDVAMLTGLSKESIMKWVEAVNRMCISLDISVKTGGKDTFLTLTAHDLEGAHIPYGLSFLEKEKVEVPVEVVKEVPVEVVVYKDRPYPVLVGSAEAKLAKPQQTTQKAKTPVKKGDGHYVWAAEPDVPPTKTIVEQPWFSELEAMVEAGRHVIIIGPPGVGKSTAIGWLANKQNQPLVNVSGQGGFHPRMVMGSAELRDGKSFYKVAQHSTACVNGWWSKVDEVNMADADMLAWFFSQVSEPYCVDLGGQSFPVAEGFRFFATMNRGLVGTKQLNPAFIDRFYGIEIGYPDENTLLGMLYANGVETPGLANGLSVVARSFWENKGLRYQLSPRRLYDAAVLIQRLKVEPVEAVKKAILPSVTFDAEKPTIQQMIESCLRGVTL